MNVCMGDNKHMKDCEQLKYPHKSTKPACFESSDPILSIPHFLAPKHPKMLSENDHSSLKHCCSLSARTVAPAQRFILECTHWILHQTPISAASQIKPFQCNNFASVLCNLTRSHHGMDCSLQKTALVACKHHTVGYMAPLPTT